MRPLLDWFRRKPHTVSSEERRRRAKAWYAKHPTDRVVSCQEAWAPESVRKKPTTNPGAPARPSFTSAASALLVCVLLLAGCQSRPVPAVAATGSALARADARVESAIPHSDPTGKELLGMARQDLSQAAASNDSVGKLLADTQTKYRDLLARWFVKCGHKLDALWRLGKWALALGALAFIVGGILKGQGGLVAQATGIIYQAGLALATGGLYLLVRVLRWAFGRWLNKKKVVPARRLRP